MSNVNMWRLILFHAEKEEPVPTDPEKNWHEISLLLGAHFLKGAAVGQINSIRLRFFDLVA
jgi:hypothetical protein